MDKKRFFRACAFSTLIFSGSAAYASTYGEYLLDGSNTAWFLQLSDTHVDTDFVFFKYYIENIEWAYTEAVPVIKPDFVVVTGDLTDSTTSAGIYGFGPLAEEWTKYKEMMTGWGMTPDFYFDVPGNHDSYGDLNLSFYLEGSVQGKATGGTQQSWRVERPGGALLFFSAATTANDGKQWPADNKELTTAELDQISSFLDSNKDAVFRMCFAHHDYLTEKVTGYSNLVYLLNQHGVYYYSHGHEHDLGVRLDSDGVIRFRIDSLGQSAGKNIGLWAVDNRAVTARVFDAGVSWPLVIVTAPADDEIGGDKEFVSNPYNPPVPKSCGSAPVRALVFDAKAVTAVSFRIDDGGWAAMKRRDSNPGQWRGYFDATALAAGEHTVTVKAVGSGTTESSNKFFVEEGIACDLGPEDPDQTADAGFPDGGAADGGQNDGAAAADSGADGGVEPDAGEDAGATDSGAAADSGPVADASNADGGPLADGGVHTADGGQIQDAGDVEPSDDPLEQSTTGCSCSAVGL